MYLLDTNTCITYLRGGESGAVAKKLATCAPDCVALCSIVIAELLYGAALSASPAKTAAEVRAFCAPFDSIPFDDRAAEEYGEIRAHLKRQGTPMGPNDLMIAAIAVANALTLITHNTAEFQRVPLLEIEDWQLAK